MEKLLKVPQTDFRTAKTPDPPTFKQLKSETFPVAIYYSPSLSSFNESLKTHPIKKCLTIVWLCMLLFVVGVVFLRGRGGWGNMVDVFLCGALILCKCILTLHIIFLNCSVACTQAHTFILTGLWTKSFYEHCTVAVLCVIIMMVIISMPDFHVQKEMQNVDTPFFYLAHEFHKLYQERLQVFSSIVWSWQRSTIFCFLRCVCVAVHPLSAAQATRQEGTATSLPHFPLPLLAIELCRFSRLFTWVKAVPLKWREDGYISFNSMVLFLSFVILWYLFDNSVQHSIFASSCLFQHFNYHNNRCHAKTCCIQPQTQASLF